MNRRPKKRVPKREQKCVPGTAAETAPEKKMKHGWLWMLVLCTVGLSACDQDPIQNYVEQSVPLKISSEAGGLVARGELNFTAISDATEYHNVCDYTPCGHAETICDAGGTVCQTQYTAQTCATNCRQEPYQSEKSLLVASAIHVSIHGIDDTSAIAGMYLGVKPNSKFLGGFVDPSQQEKGYEYLWSSLEKDQRTLLIASAKGYRLVPNQSFIALPANFKPGDLVNLDVEFETDASSAAKNGVTAVGSEVDFPALQYHP